MSLIPPIAIDLDRSFTVLENCMLRWTLAFLILAIVAAAFGFGGIAAGAVDIARILFFLFIVLFVISLVVGGFRRPIA